MVMVMVVRHGGRRRGVIRRRWVRDRAEGGARGRGGCVQVMMVVMVGWVMGMMVYRGGGPDLVPQYPRDAADRGHVVLVADAVGQQAVPDLPREDPWVLELQLLDVLDHLRGGDPGLAAADRARQYAASLVVPGQDLADTAMADPQLPRDVARPDTQLGELHYSQPNRVRQRSAVHEHAAQLVHLAVLLLLVLRLLLLLLVRAELHRVALCSETGGNEGLNRSSLCCSLGRSGSLERLFNGD